MIETKLINNFSGGMSDDHRVKDFSRYALTKHFDSRYFKHKLMPYVGVVAGGGTYGTGSGLGICKFEYGERTAGVFRLFGYGLISNPDDNRSVVYYWDGTTWQTASNTTTTAGARNEKVFFYYKGYFYFFGGNNLKRVDATSTNVINEAYQSITYTTNVVQPLIHHNDDIAYFFVDNKVHKLNNTSWTANALTLPSDMVIVDACAYGSYLAIACKSVSSYNRKSIVFLWDRDSSLTTLTERIGLGSGEILYVESLNNVLTAVIYSDSHIYSKQFEGNKIYDRDILLTDAAFSAPTMQKVKHENMLYFPLTFTLKGDSRLGIWMVNSNGKFDLEHTAKNATEYKGFYWDGTTWYYSVQNYELLKTTTTYGTSATYETLLLGETLQTKKLLSVGVLFEPIVSGQSIVLKYRPKDSGTWTEIFTFTADVAAKEGLTYHEAINIEASGLTLPEYKEIQFQITSNAGVVPTGIKYEYEYIRNQLSD